MHEIPHKISESAADFIISFSEAKVKIQGQICHTENLPHVIAQLWLKLSSPT